MTFMDEISDTSYTVAELNLVHFLAVLSLVAAIQILNECILSAKTLDNCRSVAIASVQLC